jgi:Flp pilus assembly protein TadG
MTIRSPWRRHGPDDRSGNPASRDEGGSLIEFAVTLPVLFGLIFCFMETCMALYTYEMISNSARQGTRYAMVRGAACPSATNPTCEVTAAQVNTYVSGLGWPNVGGGQVTPTTCYFSSGNSCSSSGSESPGSTVQVTVSYTFQVTMPFVPKQSITMSSTAKATIIQ